MPDVQRKKPLVERPYLSGALFWTVFSLAAVFVRGVRWDENYEFAQVILGQVPYPTGHPLYQYVRGFPSLQTYATAGLMYFFPGPLLANLLRNWIFLAASTVPVFLLGALFARRQLIGHIAAIFILLEIHVSFYSTYPIHVWPGVFSNGPVGLGYMLGTLWALLDRRFRLAGLLLGFAPAVHLGQFPPLLAVAVLHAAYLFATGQSPFARRMIYWSLPGVAGCVAFALFLRQFAVAPPVSAPYFLPVEPGVFWHTYMARYATHRAMPYTSGHLVLAAATVTGIAFVALRRLGVTPAGPVETPPPLLDSPRTWALLYCAAASFTVWGIMVVQYVMGADIPFILASWLPYRLMNHISPVLVPLLLAIGYDRDNRIPSYLPLLLLAALLAPLLHLVAPNDLVERYVNSNAYLYFMLVGAAAGTGIVLAYRRGARPTAAVLLAAAALLGALACIHQFGAACTALGIVLACVSSSFRMSERATQVSSVVLACLLLIAMLGKSFERREELPRSAFHRAVAEYLAAEGQPAAMILVPHMQVGDQAEFGHPVMADMATLLFVAYRPALAPAVAAIYQDFYGIDLDPGRTVPDPPLRWFEVWPAKTPEEWQVLSRKYDLHYVAAPDFMRLPLERVLHRGDRVLYRIP